MSKDAVALRSSICIIFICIACYFSTLFNPFVFDDLQLVQQYQAIDTLSVVGYRSLFYQVFLFFGKLGDWNPFAFHLFSLTTHCLTSFVVFFICRKISHDKTTSLIVAMLFAVHPINTETVTYISGMATGLSALLCLVCMYFYLLQRFIPAFILFALAAMVKESAVITPALVLMIDRFYIGGNILKSKRLLFFIPVLLLYAALPFTAIGKSFISQLDSSWLLVQFNVIAFAFKMIVFPINLNFDYDFPPYFFNGMGLVLCFVVACYALRRHIPGYALFGLAWFVIAIMPTNSMIPRYDLLSERNLYLPALGLIFAGVCFAKQYLSHKYLLQLSFFLVILFSTLTINRNLDYTTGYKLWRDTAIKSPNKKRVVNNRDYYFLRLN